MQPDRYFINNQIKTVGYFLSWFFLCLLFAAPAHALPLSIDVDGGDETITLETGGSDSAVFQVGNPDRLVVDLHDLRLSAADRAQIQKPKNYEGSLIKKIRAGQFDTNTLRIVLELEIPIKIIKKNEYDDQLSIKIAPLQGDKGRSVTKKSAKPVIVIDPGHGGPDPGAVAGDGTYEKDIVLDYAKRLRDRLSKNDRYRVVLTRSNDSFVPLRDRVTAARKAGADIFISLHADSAPDRDARGLSVYTLSEKASDDETEALAKRENKSDLLAGVDLSNEREDVADILISLAQRETMNQSAALADRIVAAMDGKVHLLPRTHRFAGFVVLKAPDVPSVLVELGFLSHAQDRKSLRQAAYRDRIIDGIAAGVASYMNQRAKAKNE